MGDTQGRNQAASLTKFTQHSLSGQGPNHRSHQDTDSLGKTSRKSSLYRRVTLPGSSPGPAMRTWKQVTKLLWASSKVERKTMAYFLHKVVRKKKEGRRRDRVQECFESSKRQSRASSANCTGHCWMILGWTTGIIF